MPPSIAATRVPAEVTRPRTVPEELCSSSKFPVWLAAPFNTRGTTAAPLAVIVLPPVVRTTVVFKETPRFSRFLIRAATVANPSGVANVPVPQPHGTVGVTPRVL